MTEDLAGRAADLDAQRSLGPLLRRFRRRALLTQEELAERSGVSVSTIAGVETGRVRRPRGSSLRLLADALGVTDEDRAQLIGDVRLANPEPEMSNVAIMPVPAQLPPAVAGFAGRGSHLEQLGVLMSTVADDDAGSTRIAVISGTAGVGKTALAVHWAHRIADRFPDGQLYVNLRGFDPDGQAMEAAEAVLGFLDALRVPPHQLPPTLDTRVALYRSLMAGRQMLVLLDNARASAHVRPLLPASSGCLVLVTSRHQLSGLVATHAAHQVALDLLTFAEARQMLVNRLGAGRVDDESDAVEQIIECCVRLPLALAIVAARAAARPGFSLVTVAGELACADRRMDSLTTDDRHTDVPAVFSWSYRALSPEAARLFRLLGLHPGADISAPAAASLAALHIARTRSLLAELTNIQLLTEHLPGRYTFHDLLRVYAADLTRRTEPSQERIDTTRRILDHYLHTGYTAARLLQPSRQPIALASPSSGVTPERLADHQAALDWCDAEREAILSVLSHAERCGYDRQVWQVAWTVFDYLDRRGQWQYQASTQQFAMNAAARCHDRQAEALAHRLHARALIWLGDLDDAHTHLRHALDLCVQIGDQTGQADTLLHHASLHGRAGDFVQALHRAQQALDLHRTTGHRAGYGLALNAVGWYHGRLGDYPRALAYCEAALIEFQQIDDPDGEGDAWDSLGYAYHHLGDHAQAISAYRNAIELYRSLGNEFNVAIVLIRLGDTRHATGDLDTARAHWREALGTLDELQHPHADEVRDRLATDTPSRTAPTPWGETPPVPVGVPSNTVAAE
ncbi:ATP-binding protein [Plantactinospora solaniradicis]|uniref:ATP-binding protein n=1 Tax=Plantactinospora solaniradicis TaxID=1723736 RepID=A0ABW1KG50_9ACTN